MRGADLPALFVPHSDSPRPDGFASRANPNSNLPLLQPVPRPPAKTPARLQPPRSLGVCARPNRSEPFKCGQNHWRWAGGGERSEMAVEAPLHSPQWISLS